MPEILTAFACGLIVGASAVGLIVCVIMLDRYEDARERDNHS